MKYLLLIIALFASLAGRAQNIHFDNRAGMAYAEIDSVHVPFLTGSPSVTRVYLNVTGFNSLTAAFSWQLSYATVIDSTTTNYTPIQQGSKSIPVSADYTLTEAMQYLFNYVADSLNLNITYK